MMIQFFLDFLSCDSQAVPRRPRACGYRNWRQSYQQSSARGSCLPPCPMSIPPGSKITTCSQDTPARVRWEKCGSQNVPRR